MPRFLCLWIPHFAAWAALYSDPLLRARPVLAHQGGRVVAVSHIAEQAGAEVGWTLHRAQAQLPEAVFWPIHGPTLRAVWSEVIAALLELTPCLESQRPGLLLADVRPPSLIVPLLHQWQSLGNNAQSGAPQGGVADDRATAEVAAFTAAPGTLRQVRQGLSHAFLRHIPLKVLSSADLRADTLERLGWFGWQQIGDLCPLSWRQLVTQFDQGALLFRYAQANDHRPLGFFRPSPTVSAAFSFESPVSEPYEWEPVLGLLIEQALNDLKGRGAQTLGIQITTPHGLQRRQRLLHDATIEARALYQAAHHLLSALLSESTVLRKAMVGGSMVDGDAVIQHAPRAQTLPELLLEFQPYSSPFPAHCVSFSQLVLTLGELSPPPATQGCLFGSQRPSVRIAVRAMEERFPGALRRIVMLDRRAYLPETAFRLDAVTTENIANDTQKRVSGPKTRPASRKAGRHPRKVRSQP